MKPLSYKLLSLMTAVVLLAAACQQEKLVVYEVNKEQVSLSTIDKNNYKKELEFITWLIRICLISPLTTPNCNKPLLPTPLSAIKIW
ncbi:MAG: hypothetical protein IPL35_00155 [Sphingobacteriales bacterium]|nr:hypothetical protein [Sphingobacteriales bacterium]